MLNDPFVLNIVKIKVGKTAFCKMFQDKSFSKDYTPTEFGEFSAKVTIKNKVILLKRSFTIIRFGPSVCNV